LFFFGFFENLLIYEIKDNDSIYSIKHFFEEKIAQNITKIILLNEIILSNKILLFFIIKNIGLLYEFDLKDYKYKVIRNNITFYKKEDFPYNHGFKLIKYTKLFIYSDRDLKIYNIIENNYKDINLDLDEYENIHSCQKLSDELYVIKTDKKIFIFNSTNDTVLYKIDTELHFYWIKVLLLNNNQFLIYSNINVDIYDFDHRAKNIPPKFNRKLIINNIKYIQKIKLVSTGDLIIKYNFYSLLIYDLNKNIIKYYIKNPNAQGNLLLHYSNLTEEIEPNIIAYKKKSE
jgi:hypothetical protein